MSAEVRFADKSTEDVNLRLRSRCRIENPKIMHRGHL